MYYIQCLANWLFFGDSPTWGQYLGSGLFLVGIYFIAFQNCFSKKTENSDDQESNNDISNNVDKPTFEDFGSNSIDGEQWKESTLKIQKS